jgi:hypothetical protein
MPSRTMILQHEGNETGPVRATGRVEELLGDMTVAANALINLVEAERCGIFNGIAGQRFWLNTDSVLEMAKQLVALAELRAAERRDAAQ